MTRFGRMKSRPIDSNLVWLSGYAVNIDEYPFTEIPNHVPVTAEYPFKISRSDVDKWMKHDPAWCRMTRRNYEFDVMSGDASSNLRRKRNRMRKKAELVRKKSQSTN